MRRFTVSEKELLEVRNRIFLESGIPELEKNGFFKSPFKTSWYGEYNRAIQGFSYELCRLTEQGNLEIVKVHIIKGDNYIQIFLNIFNLQPKVKYLSDLTDIEGTKYYLPPNSITKMRLRSDEYKGPPIFYMLFQPEYKIGKYCNKRGFDKKVSKLRELIKKDMNNIDSFIKRWFEMHTPLSTDLEGNIK